MKRQWSVCQHCPELRQKKLRDGDTGYQCFKGRETDYFEQEDYCSRTIKVPSGCIRRMEQIVMNQSLPETQGNDGTDSMGQQEIV